MKLLESQFKQQLSKTRHSPDMFCLFLTVPDIITGHSESAFQLPGAIRKEVSHVRCQQSLNVSRLIQKMHSEGISCTTTGSSLLDHNSYHKLVLNQQVALRLSGIVVHKQSTPLK